MKRVPIRRGESSVFPPRNPTLTTSCSLLSCDHVGYSQRRVCPSWNGRHRHTDASKRMQRRLYGREPRRFGCVLPLLLLRPVVSSFTRSSLRFPFHPVFLDLPAPWDAIEHAKKALRVRTLHPRLLMPSRTLTCYIMMYSDGELFYLPTFVRIRKTVRRGYAASVHALNKSYVPSAHSTRLVSQVRHHFFTMRPSFRR